MGQQKNIHSAFDEYTDFSQGVAMVRLNWLEIARNRGKPRVSRYFSELTVTSHQNRGLSPVYRQKKGMPNTGVPFFCSGRLKKKCHFLGMAAFLAILAILGVDRNKSSKPWPAPGLREQFPAIKGEGKPTYSWFYAENLLIKPKSSNIFI